MKVRTVIEYETPPGTPFMLIHRAISARIRSLNDQVPGLLRMEMRTSVVKDEKEGERNERQEA